MFVYVLIYKPCYFNDSFSHALSDTVAQVWPTVPDNLQASSTETIQDLRDAVKFVISCGLDTSDCLGQAIGTRVHFGAMHG